ncbi:hypothetical protein [Hungatella hathewayi]|uniref:GLUG domain-containing protein n=1 Tax=Hungatella hathewayi WAL-18680 TaxID=742737 RepID=G5ICE8_9FIRM|nr:hypothetical protein [Hungatella hathewayi]EHI60798.1 hypothetical protein HMPREF9473_01175 [ [Hungatella hathewayi WAL-18680]MBS4986915.1 hypothetical protein [Hungatella hathewayi]
MSRFILHTKTKGKQNYLLLGIVCMLVVAAAGYGLHSIGTARAKSREVVPIYTQEELEQYLLDRESEEYNLNGKYCLEEDLDMSWLYQSIGTNLEPFTGTFDGNGHVMSGLNRPLFGVVERAEIRNVFLGDAVIVHPFTYSDGEHYVDGYGALAAYAVNASMENCGMSGEIAIASPSEAEYQMAKASPADEEERKGPGEMEAGEMPVEGDSSSEETEQEIGPGIGENADSSVESGEVESGAVQATETEQEETGEKGTENGVTGEESTGETSDSGIKESSAETEKETSENVDEPSKPVDSSQETKAPTDNETSADAPADSTGGAGNSDADNSDAGNSDADNSVNDTVTNNSGTGNNTAGSGEPEADIPETVGYRAAQRQYLMMKVPAVVDADMESAVVASPSDADLEIDGPGQVGDSMDQVTGSSVADDTDNTYSHDSTNHTASQETGNIEETEEYIGNPDGDIYILITAERITAGGLSAEIAGDTLLTDCFALVTISSTQEEIDTYTGGMTGIVGGDCRIENSYAAGLADTFGVTGGFAALHEGIIQNSYSTVTIGENATACGAFTASGGGILTGCVYDRQISCTQETEETDTTVPSEEAPGASADFALKGLNTTQMTGPEASIPGTWYKAEHAYPQIPYFAQSEQELLSSSSKISAVALILPGGYTLADVLQAGDIVLPAEIDGQEIWWEAQGDIAVNEFNQVIIGGQAETATPSIAQYEAPRVQSALQEVAETEVINSGSNADFDDDSKTATDTGLETTTTNRLKASIGNTSRSFALQAIASGNGVYTSWLDVGAAVSAGTLTDITAPQLANGCYEINNAEQLAWFAYQVNRGTDTSIREANIKLTADINLDGADRYGGSKTTPLPWIPIGTADGSIYFKGTFDGNGHTIDYMKVSGQNGHSGFFAAVGGGAVIRRLGIGPHSSVTAKTNGSASTGGNADGTTDGTAALAGGIISESGKDQVVIEGCYNRAAVAGKSIHTGAFIGNGSVSNPGNQRITNCYNAGPISIAEGGTGTASGIAGTFSNDVGAGGGGIRNCYWVDSIDGIAITSAASTSETEATIEKSKAVPEMEMKKGTMVALLNESGPENFWRYCPWENDNDGYPLFFSEISTYDDTCTDWGMVGEKMALAGMTLNGEGTADSPYELGTEEELALFAYRVNQGEVSIHAKMTANLDLFGSGYTNNIFNEASPNIDEALPWAPIGNGVEYTGVFDGGGCVVSNLKIDELNVGDRGFIGVVGANAVVKNIGVASGIVRGAAHTGGVVGYVNAGNVKIINCWNNADIYSEAQNIGGVVGCSNYAGGLLIEWCYNLGNVRQAKLDSAGGIIGKPHSGAQTIRNCYNAGTIYSPKYSGGIVGDRQNNASVSIINCYNRGEVTGSGKSIMGSGNSCTVRNCYYGGAASQSQGGYGTYLPDSAMKSWALAFALNEENMTAVTTTVEGASWTNTAPGTSYPAFGPLPSAKTWDVVGQGVLDGLITGRLTGSGISGSPYEIGTDAQLAAFAQTVNGGTKKDAEAILNSSLNLLGEKYGGSATAPLLWKPIGTTDNVYQGNFDGNQKTISQMKVEQEGYAGLFGCAGSGASIKNLGLDNTCSIVSTGTTGGDGTAAFVGVVKSDNNASVNQLTVTGCYNRASVRGNTGSRTGAFVGAYEGNDGVGGQRISNCYTTGPLTAASGKPGAIAGSFTNNTSVATGGIHYCYWDAATSSASGVTLAAVSGSNPVTVGSTTKAMSTSDMSTAAAETAGGLIEQLNTDMSSPVWTRKSSHNDGYPIYTNSLFSDSWEEIGAATTAPSYKNTGSASTAGTKDNPYYIRTPEQLAWFAYQVNQNNKTGLCGELKADINLFGGLYTGNAYQTGTAEQLSKSLPWVPIGSGAKQYTGTFQGNAHIISRMFAKDGEKLGLFGTLGASASISDIAISDSRLDGSGAGYLGGIAGFAGGNNVTINFCRNVGLLTGNGENFGGILGGSETASGLVLEGCYNAKGAEVTADTGTGSAVGGILGKGSSSQEVTIRNCYNQGKVTGGSSTGGIAGNAIPGKTKIAGCYNAGPVTAGNSGHAGSIAGSGDVAGALISGCLIEDTYSYGSVNGVTIKQEIFKTWGAAFRLNGSQLNQSTGLSWINVDDAAGAIYPVLTDGALAAAENWETPAKAVEDGVIGEKPTGTPYQISTAEQLAWFAKQINDGALPANTGAVLTDNLDLAGSSYVASGKLAWVPIGKEASRAYKGKFQSSTGNSKLYQIQNLYVNTTGEAGLFGVLDTGAGISEIGIAGASVTGETAGGVAGLLKGSAEISRCYNRENSAITGTACAGGIAGQLTNSGAVKDCYNMETIIKSTGSSSYAGGIAGNGGAGSIRNCYNACRTGGSIASSGTAACSIAGGGSGSRVVQCFSDKTLADSSYVKALDCSTDAKLQTQTDSLNTVDETEKKGTDRAWFTSLTAEAAHGLPTLEAPVMLTVTLDPSAVTEAGGVLTGAQGVWSGGTTPPSNLKFRGIHQENGGSSQPGLTPTKLSDVASGYRIYGTDNAHEKLALEAGGTDLSTITTPSLTAPGITLSNVTPLKLYNGAAYTYPDKRVVLIDLADTSGDTVTRYEIRAEIAGVTRNTLDVTLPIKSGITLKPGVVPAKAYSDVPLEIVNRDSCPVEFGITEVKAQDVSADIDVKLTPVAKEFTIHDTVPITDAAQGVKLGVKGTFLAENGSTSEREIYYTPGNTPWLSCKLGYGQTLHFEYFMEYSLLHVGPEQKFGFDIIYRFGIPKEDTGNVVEQVSGS